MLSPDVQQHLFLHSDVIMTVYFQFIYIYDQFTQASSVETKTVRFTQTCQQADVSGKYASKTLRPSCAGK